MNKNFFSPSSIVLIGASTSIGKVGNDILRNLGCFLGKKYAVNPNGGTHHGVDFFTSTDDLPENIDLAIIAIPEKFVSQALQSCGQKKIKNIIIISAGFKEMGNIQGENEIISLGKKYDMNILGPNCLGFLNPHENLNASFAEKLPRAGNIALVSQSGAMATALMDWADSSGVGFSKIISMGNKSDLGECDFLEYLADDPQTDVIVLYLESLEDGRRFYEQAKILAPNKPIILVKSGISERGSLAASSHTGALTGKKEVLQMAMTQAGIHSTGFLEDLFSWSKVFSQVNIADLNDDLTIITNAGGPGVMATDNAEKFGVQLSEFSKEEEKILMTGMPNASSVHNPLDILGDGNSSRYAQMLKNIAILPKKRNILVMLTRQTPTDVENIAREIIAFKEKFPNQVVMVSFMGGKSVQEGREILERANILHFNYPKEAIKAFGVLDAQKKNSLSSSKDKNPIKLFVPEEKKLEILRHKVNQCSGLLPPSLVSELFHAFEIPFAEEKLVVSAINAVKLWESMQCEVVMKIISPDIAHKTDCGGVALNVYGKSQVESTFDSIIASSKRAYPNARISGVSLQKMFPTSREVFIGAKRDKSFGEILLFGLGGVYVNLFEDISRRMAPVSPMEIKKMISEVKSYPLLQGLRGESSVDFLELENIIFNLQSLFLAFESITDIDLNPVFAREDGAWVIDAKIFTQ